MKTLLRLTVLLLFASSCTFFNKTKDTAVDDQVIPLKEEADAAIPTEYSAVDTIMRLDTSMVVEAPPEPTEPLEFMTIEEWEMINEINLLRGDPQAYLRFVDTYLEAFVKNSAWGALEKQEEMAAVNELRGELQRMEPRTALYPYYKLHQIAAKHGEDMKAMDQINHIGSDGSHPYQRIQNNSELDGTENLVGGHSTVREAIISLLVDGGVSNRGHRQNLLDSRWQYLACSHVDTVAGIPNVWVQLFAFDDPNEEAIPEMPTSGSGSIGDKEPSQKSVLPTAQKEDTKVSSIVPEATKPERIEKKVITATNSFLTSEEQEMVDEINLMRSNPVAYIQYVEEYAKEYKAHRFGADPQFESAVMELKAVLKNMEALSRLVPNEKLYEVAKAHGLDNKTHNQLEHTGTDGSDPFDRVKRSGLKNHIDKRGYFTPNENLVGGEPTVRKAVLALLIDSGIPNRGHRKALLDPNWEYVACYKIGLIENLPELRGNENDNMEHCWVQLFAKS